MNSDKRTPEQRVADSVRRDSIRKNHPDLERNRVLGNLKEAFNRGQFTKREYDSLYVVFDKEYPGK
jgi:hypothetical protein